MHKENLEQLTARAAKLAAAARTLKRQSGVSTPFSLAFLTDNDRAPEPWLIACALPRGSAVILRDYEREDRAALAARLKAACVKSGVLLLVGADVALAEHVAADGVHFPAWHSGPYGIFPGAIRTASCHSAADLERAGMSGIDVALLSPAFKTASHPGGAALGAKVFRSLAAASPTPVLALGGVTENNAQYLAGANVAGVAAIGAFLS